MAIPTTSVATPGLARPTARTGSTTAWCPRRRRNESLESAGRCFGKFRLGLRRVLMNWNHGVTYVQHSSTAVAVSFGKRLMILGAAALLTTVSALPQNPALQEKLAAV